MTNIKIGLDVAGIEADVKKVEAAGARGAAAVSKGLNSKEAGRSLDHLLGKMEALADKLGELHEHDVLNVGSLSKGVQALENAVKTARNLERLTGGKAGDRSYGFSKLVDELRAVEHGMRQSAQSQAFLRSMGGIGRDSARDLARGLIPSNIGTGIALNAARYAESQEGGLLSRRGLGIMGMGLGIGAAAWGVSKIAHGVREKIGAAQNEGITLSETRMMLGPLTTDFAALRNSVHALTEGFGVANNEAAQMAKEMAHISGGVGEDLRTGAAFGRGYGIDPRQSTRFFAEARHFGATRNEADNRRLAILIGEAVTRGGTAHRMDEVLSAVGNFTQMAARTSLTTPAVGGFTSLLSSLTGLNLPGLRGDPGNAAGLITQADAAIRSGGRMGEASKSFMLAALTQQIPNFSALDLGLVNDQGAFGTVASTFGPESPAYKMAEAMGDKGAMARYRDYVARDDHQFTLTRKLRSMKALAGGNIDFFRKSIAGDFGLSDTQAAVLATATMSEQSLGRLEAGVRKAGLDPLTINPGSIARIAQLTNATDRSDIYAQRDRLLKMKLSDPEKGELGTGDYGKLTDAVIRLTAKYDNLDEGAAARQAQIDLDNKFEEFATKAVPLLTEINKHLLWVAKHIPGMEPYPEQDAAALAERKQKAQEDGQNELRKEDSLLFLRKRVARDDALEKLAKWKFAGDLNEKGGPLSDRARQLGETAVNDLTDPKISGRERGRLLNQYRKYWRLNPQMYPQGFGGFLDEVEKAGGPDGEGRADVIEKIRAEASRQGVDPGVALSLAERESGFNPVSQGPVIKNGMHRGDRAFGPYQYMARSSRGWNRFDLDQNIQHGVADLLRHRQMFGSWDLAVAAHHAGEGNRSIRSGHIPGSSDGHASTASYVRDIMRRAGDWRKASGDARVPRARQRAPDGKHAFSFNHTITVQDPRGVALADAVVNTHEVGFPVPAGMG